MSLTQPYRIGTAYKTRPTDGRPQIIATMRGPVSPRRLTYNVDLSKSADENHHNAAHALADKYVNARAVAQGYRAVTVREVSSNDSGTRRDWEVIV